MSFGLMDALQIGGSAIGGALSFNQAQKNIDWQKRVYEEQKERQDNQIQRTVADAQKAGINPVDVLGGGGGGVVSAPQLENPMNGLMSLMPSMGDAFKNAFEREENEKGRGHESGENEKDREFQREEAEKDRWHDMNITEMELEMQRTLKDMDIENSQTIETMRQAFEENENTKKLAQEALFHMDEQELEKNKLEIESARQKLEELKYIDDKELLMQQVNLLRKENFFKSQTMQAEFDLIREQAEQAKYQNDMAPVEWGVDQLQELLKTLLPWGSKGKGKEK